MTLTHDARRGVAGEKEETTASKRKSRIVSHGRRAYASAHDRCVPLLTWEELCADKSLQDLPYRIELNALNQIVMSPLHFRHGYYQAEIANLLKQLLPNGKAGVESAIFTSDNVKVPDVIWAAHEFFRLHADAYALPVAPDVCVEVLSPTNRPEELSKSARSISRAARRRSGFAASKATWNSMCRAANWRAQPFARRSRCTASFRVRLIG